MVKVIGTLLVNPDVRGTTWQWDIRHRCGVLIDGQSGYPSEFEARLAGLEALFVQPDPHEPMPAAQTLGAD